MAHKFAPCDASSNGEPASFLHSSQKISSELPVSDETLESVEQWLLAVLRETHDPITPAQLLAKAADSAESPSPSDVTWALWYLVGERKVQVTPDHLVTAAA